MASSKEKFELVFTAQELASKKIRALNKQLSLLGGPKLVKSRKQINKLERDIKGLSGAAKKGSIVFSRFTQGIAAGNIIANVVSSAMRLLKASINEVGKATMVAANVQELGNVLQFVGQRAGYASGEINGYVTQLRENGIAQKESNNALLRAIQGNIDLTDAVKLGRIAQDAAVIGQTNSSDAYMTLIDSVVKGRVVLLKSLGIQGTFQSAYKKLAKTLNKTQTELTEAERLQARLNLVMEGGEVIAGAYEIAMGSASKQFRSMDRLVQDLQVSVGQYLVPSFSVLVVELGKTTKELTNAFTGDSKEGAQRLAVDIGQVVASFILLGKIVFNAGQIVSNTLEIAFLYPIEAVIIAATALYTALSDPFNLDAWADAGNVMLTIFDPIKEDWNDIKGHIKDSEQAVIDFALTVGRLEEMATEKEADPMIAIEARLAKFRAHALGIAAITEDTEAKIIETTNVATMGMVETTSAAGQVMQSTGQQMQVMFGQAVGGMIDNMVTGRQSFGEIFKGIAQDFMSFFIKSALMAVVNTFIPGLGGMLGNMFDTPVNDRMAAGQGSDFMQWFTRGMIAEAQGGSEMATGIAHSSNRIVPVASGNSGGGGMVNMNVTVSGNVLTDQYIEKTIAPQLQRLVNDGRSSLSVQDENKTGGRDVNIN